MKETYSSEEIKKIFYSIYNNDPANLKHVTIELVNKGLGYIEIVQLTIKELNIGLGDAIMLLEVPDYRG